METKTIDQVERFSLAVSSFGIQEVEGKSYIINGNRNLHTKVMLLDMRLGMKPKNYDRELGYTSLTSVPGSQLGLDNSQSGIVVQFFAKSVDLSGRDSAITSVFAMPLGEAQDFMSVCKSAPEVLYETLKKVNSGPIKSASGNMDIRSGEKITIVANTNVGGSINSNQSSVNFRSDYKPNA